MIRLLFLLAAILQADVADSAPCETKNLPPDIQAFWNQPRVADFIEIKESALKNSLDRLKGLEYLELGADEYKAVSGRARTKKYSYLIKSVRFADAAGGAYEIRPYKASLLVFYNVLGNGAVCEHGVLAVELDSRISKIYSGAGATR